MLAKMAPPYFPIALGVIRSALFPTYDDLVEEQIKRSKQKTQLKTLMICSTAEIRGK
jgi:hypothetical protein